MRLRALAPFLLSWVLVAAALSLNHVCCCLDALLGNDLTLDIFLRGDLHELAKFHWFWAELLSWLLTPFTHSHHDFVSQLHLRAFVPTALFAVGLAVLWHRRGRTDHARAGMLCLCFAIVPWCTGRWLLTGISAPSEAGQHLRLMIAGLFWCAVASLMFCGRQLFARRSRTTTPAPELAAAT